MVAMHEERPERTILLVYYSPDACRRLEEALIGLDLEAYFVNGRSPEAVEELRRNPAKVVVIDHSAGDVSITQAVRRVGQVLPTSLVITTSPLGNVVELYRAGHRVGAAESLDAVIGKCARHVGANLNKE